MRVAYDGERMCVRTRCRDIEQLVCTFRHHVRGTSLFVSTLGARPVGTESPFEISLADGTVVIRGRCVIREAWSNTDNPFYRPGILIKIRALTRSSRLVFDRLACNPPELDPTRVPIPQSPHLQRGAVRTVTAPMPVPTVTPAILDDPEAAFVTDSGTFLGAGSRRRRPPSDAADADVDALLAMLQASAAPAHTPDRPRRTTRSVPVRVTIPPRGAIGESARPRIETAPLVSAPPATVMEKTLVEPVCNDTQPVLPASSTAESAPPSMNVAVSNEPNGKAAAATTTTVAAGDEVLPEAMPEEVSAATTEPLLVPTGLPRAKPRTPKPLRKYERQPSNDSMPLKRPPSQPITAPTTAMECPSQAPLHVLPANPLMALTDSALAGYVDCTLFEATDGAAGNTTRRDPDRLYTSPSDGPVPSLRPARTAMWWTLAALVLGAGTVGAFQMRTEAAASVRKADVVPTHSMEAQPATTRSFDLQVVPRTAPGSEGDPEHVIFDVVVTPRCASEPIAN